MDTSMNRRQFGVRLMGAAGLSALALRLPGAQAKAADVAPVCSVSNTELQQPSQPNIQLPQLATKDPADPNFTWDAVRNFWAETIKLEYIWQLPLVSDKDVLGYIDALVQGKTTDNSRYPADQAWNVKLPKATRFKDETKNFFLVYDNGMNTLQLVVENAKKANIAFPPAIPWRLPTLYQIVETTPFADGFPSS